MLKNEYLVAKIGVDTAENEPSKVSVFSEFHREFHIRIPPDDLAAESGIHLVCL